MVSVLIVLKIKCPKFVFPSRNQELIMNVYVNYRDYCNLRDGKLAVKVSLGSLSPAAFPAVTVNW